MKRGIFGSALGGSVMFLLASLPASGADLLSVYDQALVNDPQIREADALRLAQREARPQALARLLPQASFSASRSRSWNSNEGSQQIYPGDPNPTGIDSKGRTTGSQWNLSLRQNVFSWQNWVALSSANFQVAQAEADYEAQLQSLAQRVAQQYFAVLNAQDNVRAQEAARDAIARQLEQADRKFEVGLIAITDVQDAKAERDTSAAQVIAAKRTLASAEEALRATIGEKPVVLNGPPENMALLSPDPTSAEDWVRLSMEQNASLVSSRLAADIARNNVRSAFGGHLPTIELNASRSSNESDGKSRRYNVLTQDYDAPTFSASETNGKSISLQFNLPLFSGGATQSQVRQSQYNWIAAKERLERTSRTTERNARDAFLGVNSEIARVTALKQALESSRTALSATEAGNEVGTRTAADVLNSRRLLVQAETNYSSAKYSYLNNMIQLRLVAGNLDRQTIEEINRLLTVTPTPPAQ